MKNLLYAVLAATLIFSNISNAMAQTYCNAQGNSTADEWIESINIGSFSNTSGDNSGYLNNTSNQIELTGGESYSVSFNTGYTDPSNPFTEHWRVWIDIDDNGSFEADEMLIDSGAGVTNNLTTSLALPTIENTTQTKMRIAMKWVGSFSDGEQDLSAPEACGTFEYGEVEDYNVTLQAGDSTGNNNELYCVAAGNSTADEWIESINIGDFTNTSGNNNGYLNSTTQNINLTVGETYNFSFETGYTDASNPFDEYWKVWVDWNNNQTFEDSELWYDAGSGSPNSVTGNLTVPSNLSETNTTMRIAMKWVGDYSDGTNDLTAPEACGDFAFGEVEDYSVNVTTGEVNNNNTPVADFIANNTAGEAPFVVSFVDLSSNNPSNWSWSFPGADITTSTEENPQVSYSTPGVYSVALTVTNTAGSNTTTKTDYITVSETGTGLPNAAFTASINSGNGPLTVTFFNQSTNATNFEWSFPGAVPASSTEENPTVTYNNPGLFNVSLIASNDDGFSDEQEQEGFIMVEEIVGLDEIDISNAINVFPNPASNFININLSNTQIVEEIIRIDIYNLIGKIEKSFDNRMINQSIDISNLPKGTYMISVVTENEHITKKLIKE